MGGQTAIQRDYRAAARRDDLVVPPLVLLVVFAILAAVLRALYLPALLIASVVVSYGAALGTGAFLFSTPFGFAGEEPSIVLLAVTGTVITSAGVVLAGTFSTLAVLPLVALTEIGFLVAFGVLLDTLIVRSILVPALALDAGRRVWWPSRLARRLVH